MKFHKGQKIVCISDQKEWDSVIGDFNINLMIAVNSICLPKKNNVYTVNNPMELFYNKKCYISIEENNSYIFDESGFVEIDFLENENHIKKQLKKTMTINN